METLQQLETELNELKCERELMQRISTDTGFYKEYFALLPNFNTKEETFNHLNNVYLKLFGEFKYNDFETFKKKQLN